MGRQCPSWGWCAGMSPAHAVPAHGVSGGHEPVLVPGWPAPPPWDAGPVTPADRPGSVCGIGADSARYGNDGGAGARPGYLPVWSGKGGGALGPPGRSHGPELLSVHLRGRSERHWTPGSVAWISILCDVVQLAFTAGLVARPGIGMGGYVLGTLVTSALGLALCAWQVVRATACGSGCSSGPPPRDWPPCSWLW